MLIWIFIDMFLSKLVIPLFHYLGMDIQTFFYSKSFHGGGIEIVTAMIIISILKTVIPIIYLNKKMRLPNDVRFMKTLNRQNNLIMAIALSVAASTVICLPNIYKDSNATQLYRYFSSLEADTAAWGQTEYIVYIIFDIIILSVLVEILFRGSMFAALRQFGDWFAILITAVVSGLLACTGCKGISCICAYFCYCRYGYAYDRFNLYSIFRKNYFQDVQIYNRNT